MSREVLYHGSREEYEELEGNDPGYGGSLGYGLYLTTMVSMAERFGRYIHEVTSPVPDELVAELELDVLECGDTMEMYTSGSSPFTFDIVDRSTGEKHRYSVLGNCEHEVTGSMRSSEVKDYEPTPTLTDRVAACPKLVQTAVGAAWNAAVARVTNPESHKYGELVGNVIDDTLEDWVYEYEDGDEEREFGDENRAAADALAKELAEDIDRVVEENVRARLGEEIDLNELSRICEEHGYSAFYIDGYAPQGDEYVIIDDNYLPLPVQKVTVRRR